MPRQAERKRNGASTLKADVDNATVATMCACNRCLRWLYPEVCGCSLFYLCFTEEDFLMDTSIAIQVLPSVLEDEEICRIVDE